MKLIYLAHPVKGAVKYNMAKAKLWLKWLTESREEPTAVIAPWLTDIEIWDDGNPEDRAAGLERCKAVIPRCDEIWLVGGYVQEGGEMERRHAMRHGVTVVDVTCMGEWPPDVTEEEKIRIQFCCSPPIVAPPGPAQDADLKRSSGHQCVVCQRTLVGAEAHQLHRQWYCPRHHAEAAPHRPGCHCPDCPQRAAPTVDPFSIPVDEDHFVGPKHPSGTLSEGPPARCAKCLTGIAGRGHHFKHGRFWYCKAHCPHAWFNGTCTCCGLQWQDWMADGARGQT